MSIGIVPYSGRVKLAFLFLFLLFISVPEGGLKAQDREPFTPEQFTDSLDNQYGADPTIFNGEVWVNPNQGARSTPFLYNSDFLPGTVTIRNQEYQNLLLRFDAFSQRLVVKYENRFGGVRHLKMSDAWIDAFTIGDMHFKRVEIAGIRKYLEVFGDDDLCIGIYWSKELLFNATNINPGYYYSPEKKTFYLLRAGEILAFRNNRSLVKLFDRNDQDKISSFLKVNGVDIRKANANDMLKFTEYFKKLK